jgi:hypothetical protein
MFGHLGIHLSNFARTQRTLSFYRHVRGIRASGEETSELQLFCEVLCDVQPVGNMGKASTKLAHVTTQAYQITIKGDHAIQRQDRTYIDDAECVVESVHRWRGHTEIEVAGRQPTPHANIAAGVER